MALTKHDRDLFRDELKLAVDKLWAKYPKLDLHEVAEACIGRGEMIKDERRLKERKRREEVRAAAAAAEKAAEAQAAREAAAAAPKAATVVPGGPAGPRAPGLVAKAKEAVKK